MANNGCAFSPFFLTFYISRRADGPKSFIHKHLGFKLSPQRTELALYKPPLIGYNASMKFIVERYHSSPVTFSSLFEALDFAMNCGDFSQITTEKDGQLILGVV